jgi:hypothetical protein
VQAVGKNGRETSLTVKLKEENVANGTVLTPCYITTGNETALDAAAAIAAGSCLAWSAWRLTPRQRLLTAGVSSALRGWLTPPPGARLDAAAHPSACLWFTYTDAHVHTRPLQLRSGGECSATQAHATDP